MTPRVPALRRDGRWRPTALSLSFLAFCLAFSVSAQQTTAPSNTEKEKDEKIELSPFVVNAQQDRGYRATSTLAGSRINTPLKDLAASITEITPEFLKDVSARDINDVLMYQANTESTQTFTNSPQSGIGGYEDRNQSNPNTANRVRGLNTATLTRDYFITIGSDVGFDSYNVDRVTINRGPNSILFGLGDPAGIVNYAPKLAKLDRNSNEVSARYGSNDDMRATFDFNRILLKNQLALRVAGVWSDRGFKQEPAFYRDDRIYLTGTYSPFKQTTLRATYEYARVRQRTPNTITPIDHITSWIAAGRPTWDPRTDNWSTRPTTGFNTTAGGTTVGATRPDGTLEYAFVEGMGERFWATWWQPNQPNVGVFSSLGMSDNRYVDLHESNLRSNVVTRDLATFQLSWDQQIVKNLFLNVAYISEDQDAKALGGFRPNQFGVHIDINRYLPNGTPNPHFGETFIPDRSLDSKNLNNNRNESVRGTLSYTLDLNDKTGLIRWLGRHAFTGYAEDRTLESWSNTYNGTRVGDWPYLDPRDRINPSTWQITYLRYLGGSTDRPVAHPPVPVQRHAQNVPNTYWNTTTASWAQDTWGDYFALKRRDIGENGVTSSAFVWQASFLKNRLIGTAGWRRDRNSVATRSFTDRNPLTGVVDQISTPLPVATLVKGETKTYGVVAHPLKWLSLHYNRSENFQARAGDVDIFGKLIGVPQGTGKDYGFSLDLMDGRITTRVNWYEVESTNARMPFTGPVVAGQWELPWFDQVVIPGLAAKYGRTWGASDRFTPITFGDARIAEVSSQLSKGMEIEAIFNPTNNWRIMANVSKQKAVESDIAPGLTRWIAEVLPKWQQLPWWNGTETFDGGWGFNGNLQGYINNFNSGRTLATYKAFEGRTNPALRKWRANFINNYSFTQGRLRGFNAGGAVRWESEAAIGYPAVLTNGLLTGLDLSRAYTDGGNLNVDLWAGYTRKIFGDRINWNLQLNVRDVNQKDRLEPIVKNSDGTPAVYSIRFGPTWYLTSTFTF